MILEPNDTIMLIACSNELDYKYSKVINKMIYILKSFKLNVIISDSLYKKDNMYSPGSYRASELMKGFMNTNIKCIFDVSGGDLSIELLPYLDFDIIRQSKAKYYGYSDLSVILNSIYAKANKSSFYYNIKTILTKDGFNNFYSTFIYAKSTFNLFNSWKFNWINGSFMSGVVLGGNIRCTLKLSGTIYMPSFKDKILFLESNSGDITKMRSFIAQYKLLGIFNDINGIILGEFTEINSNNELNLLNKLFIDICKEHNIPLIKTNEIGHSSLSKGIAIGSYINIKKSME